MGTGSGASIAGRHKTKKPGPNYRLQGQQRDRGPGAGVRVRRRRGTSLVMRERGRERERETPYRSGGRGGKKKKKHVEFGMSWEVRLVWSLCLLRGFEGRLSIHATPAEKAATSGAENIGPGPQRIWLAGFNYGRCRNLATTLLCAHAPTYVPIGYICCVNILAVKYFVYVKNKPPKWTVETTCSSLHSIARLGRISRGRLGVTGQTPQTRGNCGKRPEQAISSVVKELRGQAGEVRWSLAQKRAEAGQYGAEPRCRPEGSKDVVVGRRQGVYGRLALGRAAQPSVTNPFNDETPQNIPLLFDYSASPRLHLVSDVSYLLLPARSSTFPTFFARFNST
ncbi:hypothetical protein J6590_027908 [Homalodisca vitripennis]|nr:hypothetical protein J6590_027908 [Homalodisca vitripennis]